MTLCTLPALKSSTCAFIRLSPACILTAAAQQRKADCIVFGKDECSGAPAAWPLCRAAAPARACARRPATCGSRPPSSAQQQPLQMQTQMHSKLALFFKDLHARLLSTGMGLRSMHAGRQRQHLREGAGRDDNDALGRRLAGRPLPQQCPDQRDHLQRLPAPHNRSTARDHRYACLALWFVSACMLCKI